MSFWRSLPWNFFLALVVLKIVFWQLSLFEHFCACCCEDVSCPRVFENDIMSLLALKICILLLIIVIWKRFKKSWKSSWKMERLKFQNLWFVKMKKKLDFTFYLLLERISQLNFIYPCIKLSDSTTSIFLENQTEIFLEIPLQTFRIQPCMYGIPEFKRFFTSLFTVWKHKE